MPLTFKTLGNLLIDKTTYKILGMSLLRLLICLSISFVVALVLAILAIRFKYVKYFFSPNIGLIKTLPMVVIIVLLLVIFNKAIAIYVISSFVMLPILYEGIVAGFNNIDKEALEDIKTVSNFNLLIASKIYIPLSTPFILTALLQSFGLGLKVSVMAEYISLPNDSIGKELYFHKNYSFEMEYVVAWSIILVIVVLLVEGIIKYTNYKFKKGI